MTFNSNDDEILLFRGQRPINSFLSAFGHLSETRLTAALGYLIAKAPTFFLPLFLSSKDTLKKVTIEESDEGKRLDLLLEGSHTLTRIEAKLGPIQRLDQVRRYVRSIGRPVSQRLKLVLLDSGSEPSDPKLRELVGRIRQRWTITFVGWNQIHAACRKAQESKKLALEDPFTSAFVEQFANYLEDLNMVNGPDNDIYSRDLSGDSLALFFQRRIYKCQKEFYRSASKAKYFAPYFTNRAPQDFATVSIVGIEPGISYIAKINAISVVRRNGVEEFLKAHNWPDAAKAAKNIRTLSTLHELTLMLLGKPYRIFHPPVTKRMLGSRGALGARTYSLDYLLEAREAKS